MKIPKKALDRTSPEFRKTMKAWLIHFRVLEEAYIEAEGETMQTITNEFEPLLMKMFKEEATKKGHVDLTVPLMAYAITKHLCAKKENAPLVREWRQMMNEDDKNHMLYDIADFLNEFVVGVLQYGLAYDIRK